MPYRPKHLCNCPFYEKEYKKGICCEGLAEGINNTMYFMSEEQKDAYIKAHCIKMRPTNCKLYNLLMEKYEAD